MHVKKYHDFILQIARYNLISAKTKAKNYKEWKIQTNKMYSCLQQKVSTRQNSYKIW